MVQSKPGGLVRCEVIADGNHDDVADGDGRMGYGRMRLFGPAAVPGVRFPVRNLELDPSAPLGMDPVFGRLVLMRTCFRVS